MENNPLEEKRKLWEQLLADVKACARIRRSDDSQRNRRAYVRTTFAAIEALAHLLRVKVMQYLELDIQCKASNALRHDKRSKDHDVHRIEWAKTKTDIPEYYLLREESHRLDDTGRVRAQFSRFPFAQHVAFSIRMYAKHWGWMESDHFFSDSRWGDFRNAVRIRNRITHPKELADIELSDDDMDVVHRAENWFQEAFHQMVNIHRTRFEETDLS